MSSTPADAVPTNPAADASPAPAQPRRLPSAATWLVILAALGLYLAGAGRVSLWDRDEAWYATTSRQMVQSGDWVITRFLDDLRFAKPILIYWCQAASMKLVGISTPQSAAFAARLPSALGMTATLVLLALVFTRFAGHRIARDVVLIFSTSAMVIVSAKMCLIDAVMLLLVTGAQMCLFRLYHLHHEQAARLSATRRTALLLWLCVALAGLSKGPFVLILMTSTVLALGLLDIGLQWRHAQAWRLHAAWWRSLRPLWGLAIIVLVVAPWLITAYVRNPLFVRSMLFEPVAHLSSNQDGHAVYPGYFYISTIWLLMFPWSLLLPAALIFAWRARREPAVRFALAIILGNWVFIEIMVTKLPHYFLPSYASLAFLSALAIARLRQHCNWGLARVFAGIWGVGAFLILAVFWYAVRPFEDYPVAGLLAFTATGSAYAIGVFVLIYLRRLRPAVSLMGFGMIALIAIAYTLVLPRSPFLRIPERAGTALVQLGATHKGDVVMVGYAEPSLAFYQGGTIREADAKLLAEGAPQSLPRWVVTYRALYQALPEARRGQWRVIASYHGLNYNKDQRTTPGGVVDVVILQRQF